MTDHALGRAAAQRIEDAVRQLLALDPTNSYANEVMRKLPHFRERAAEIVAARKFVGEPDKNLTSTRQG